MNDVSVDVLKKIIPKKFIKPLTFQIRKPQSIKIEEIYENLQQRYKNFKPKKIELQYYRNKILGRDNIENTILI